MLATYTTAGGGRIQLFIDGVSQGTAAYGATTCSNATLNIGGYFTQGALSNAIYGRRGRSASVLDRPLYLELYSAHTHDSGDGNTTFLTHLDQASGAAPFAEYIPSLWNLNNVTLPDFYDAQATAYAVEQFLQRDCGVQWLNATPTGSVYPSTSTLIVSGSTVTQTPAMAMRDTGVIFGTPQNNYNVGMGDLWIYGTTGYNGYIAAAYPGETQAQMDRDAQLFLHRMGEGGQDLHANSGFGNWYNRFYLVGQPTYPNGSPNPYYNPSDPQDYHPDWFADYYTNSYHYVASDSQLCYTNPAVIAQAAQDVANYYNTYGYNVRPFNIAPMDNGRFNPNDEGTGPLQWEPNYTGYFSNGSVSNYLFNFINNVVTALHAIPGHANDKVGTIAYSQWAAVPTGFTLNPSVNVLYCFAENRMVYDTAGYDHELGYVQAWSNEAATSGRTIGLWLYPGFPWGDGSDSNSTFNVFPGYYAHSLATQIDQFVADGYTAIYDCGGGQDVEEYVQEKLMNDPTQNVDTLLNNYFSAMYGPAATAMHNFYNLVEQTYSDPANYPPDYAASAWPNHESEIVAWGWLGTADVMAQLQADMTQAATAAGSNNPYATNVNLFNLGTWSYMQQGRQDYLTNYVPPTASITSPSDGTVYTSPANITINATASDSDGTVSKVEFYENGTLLGTDTTAPYSWTWNNPAIGTYNLRAVAYDNDQNPMASNTVSVSVARLLTWDPDCTNNSHFGCVTGQTDDWTKPLAWVDALTGTRYTWDGNLSYSEAVFSGTAGTVTVNGSINADAILFQTDGYTVNSGTVTLVGGNITTGNGADTINSVLAGSVGLTKLGAGTLVLTGANTYSGISTLSAGVLQLGLNAAGPSA